MISVIYMYIVYPDTFDIPHPDWYEKRRAIKEGRYTNKSWLIFCMFDKGPLILLSGTAFLLCIGSVVGWSLVLAYYS